MTRKILHSTLLSIVLLSILASCSKHVYKSSGDTALLFPDPPDTARIQFLTRYGNSADIEGNPSKLKSFVVGKKEPLPIVKPYGIDLYKGKILVVDPGIAGLQILDVENETFAYFIPDGRGKLKKPLNCNFDENGSLYVTDVGRQQVVIFNEEMEYAGELVGNVNFKPTDVFVVGDSILVTDPTNNRINVYDRSSLSQIGSFPEEAKEGDVNWLYNPLNLYVQKDRIYVTDFGHSSVKIFTMDGKYLSSVGSYGRGLGQFTRPKGIAIDQDQNLYVVDAAFQNIQIFNSNRQLLMYFGGPYNGPGYMYLPANVTIDFENLQYFEKFVAPEFDLKYLIFVTNQYGPDKVSVYGRIEPK